MSLVTIFSNQYYAVSARRAESAKSPGDESAYMLCQQKFHESAINELIQQTYATHFDARPTACGLLPGSGFCRRSTDILSIHLAVSIFVIIKYSTY